MLLIKLSTTTTTTRSRLTSAVSSTISTLSYMIWTVLILSYGRLLCDAQASSSPASILADSLPSNDHPTETIPLIETLEDVELITYFLLRQHKYTHEDLVKNGFDVVDFHRFLDNLKHGKLDKDIDFGEPTHSYLDHIRAEDEITGTEDETHEDDVDRDQGYNNDTLTSLTSYTNHHGHYEDHHLLNCNKLDALWSKVPSGGSPGSKDHPFSSHIDDERKRLKLKKLCEISLGCQSSEELLELIRVSRRPQDPNRGLSLSKSIAKLCPLMLFQLHTESCQASRDHNLKLKSRPTTGSVWAFGILFVTIISCCSLIGVAIMPLLTKHSYEAILTLFTGLAVGSLTGSAIFHLIPQAFNLLGEDSEHGYLWKALIIFGGIYLFYWSERIMKIAADVRRRRKLKEKAYQLSVLESDEKSAMCNEMMDQNKHVTFINIKEQSSSSNGAARPVGPTVDGSLGLKPNEITPLSNASLATDKDGLADGSADQFYNHDHKQVPDGIAKISGSAPNDKEITHVPNLSHQHHHQDGSDGSMRSSFLEYGRSERSRSNSFNRQLPVHHGHSHGTTPNSEEGVIATVAWMIIFGDGLHNFIDGLSIGAAFSESILAGISISVAVICEEFPHELGDFAVLISSGMSIRQALGYNFLSACTCYLGLGFGILIGDLDEGSASYIFALAGGMFLYIALVDMMGELSNALEEAGQKSMSETIKVLILQNIGILVGIASLFLLARYSEHINFEGLAPPQHDIKEGKPLLTPMR